MRQELFNQVEIILDDIERMVYEKTGIELMEYQWRLGLVLSDCSERDIGQVSNELGVWFSMPAKFFVDAFWLYQLCPKLEQAVRCAK